MSSESFDPPVANADPPVATESRYAGPVRRWLGMLCYVAAAMSGLIPMILLIDESAKLRIRISNAELTLYLLGAAAFGLSVCRLRHSSTLRDRRCVALDRSKRKRPSDSRADYGLPGDLGDWLAGTRDVCGTSRFSSYCGITTYAVMGIASFDIDDRAAVAIS